MMRASAEEGARGEAERTDDRGERRLGPGPALAGLEGIAVTAFGPLAPPVRRALPQAAGRLAEAARLDPAGLTVS